MPRPTFRTAAAPEDVPAVVALVQSAYRGDGSRSGWTTEADLLDGQRIDPPMLTALLAEPAVTVVLAEQVSAGVPELLACFELRAPATPGGEAYFGMFAVRPGLQGVGLGRTVLAEGERRAAAAGAGSLELTVIGLRTELIQWYERRGYLRTGDRRPFPYADERFGRPRRPDLDFVVLRKRLPATA